MSLQDLLFCILIVSATISIVLVPGYFLIIYLLSKLIGKPVQKGEGHTPEVSIVVPCHNEVGHIEGKIRELASISYPRSLMTVIFVDDGSTDGTARLLDAQAQSGNVMLIKLASRRGKSSAINEALKVAHGDIIILTDADSNLESDALADAVANFADPTVGAVVGRITIYGDSFVSRLNAAFHDLFRERPRQWESDLDSASFLSGAFLAYRRDLVGPLGVDAVCDELYVLFEARKKGYRCIVDPSVVVSTHNIRTVAGQVSQRRRTTAGTLQAFFAHRDILWNTRLGVFGLVIAPVNLLRIIMLPISLLIGEASLLALIVLSPVVLEVLVIAVLPLLILYAYSPTRRFVSGILFIFMAEVAMLLGIYDCMRGKQTVLWTRGTKYQPQRVTCLGSTR